MNKKRLNKLLSITLSTVFMAGLTSTTIFADQLKEKKEDSAKPKIEIKEETKKGVIIQEILHPSFEDFMKNDIKKKDVSKKDLKTLKELYTKFINSLKADDLDSAKTIMDEFMKIANKYEDLYKSTYVAPKTPDSNKVIPQEILHPSFEDFMKNDIKKKDVSKKDLKTLKGLYTKFIDSLKTDDLDSAKTIMDEFMKIANKYEDLYKSTYVAPKTPDVKKVRPQEVKYPSFEDFMKNDIKKKDISKEDMETLKELYLKYVANMKEGKSAAAKDIMTEFKNIADKYENLYSSTYVEEPYTPDTSKPSVKPEQPKLLTFDEFIAADLKIDLDEENYAALSSIYSEAIKYKKEGKYERYYELIEEIFNLSKDLVD